MIDKMLQTSGKNQSKLIKSLTSCGGHLARADLSMYYSSANTCQNQVKLCTLEVQDDMQLVMPKVCLSVKDCRSQASFNDSTIIGSGNEHISPRIKIFKLPGENLFCFLVLKFQLILTSDC